MGNSSDQYFRTEPVFKLKTPLLFSHRGGAREAPESTVRGFRHAIDAARSDVLELDVQLTLDGEFVVWHGPELSNVRIEAEIDRPIERKRNKIYDFSWTELKGKAWVADPAGKDPPDERVDLSNVPREDDRCLLLLSEFLGKFPDIPLNIEIKESFNRKINETDRKGLKDNIRAFSEVLLNDPSRRTIVVVSATDNYIDEFRKLNGDRFPTGLSTQEQLILMLLPALRIKNRALETIHHHLVSNKSLIAKVRESGGSTFVFLTEFATLFPAIDARIPSEEEIFEILDRGVDGIMTDRPQCLRGLMNKWISSRAKSKVSKKYKPSSKAKPIRRTKRRPI
jgi:glycerophosphoryl diester phosphodiesterase